MAHNKSLGMLYNATGILCVRVRMLMCVWTREKCEGAQQSEPGADASLRNEGLCHTAAPQLICKAADKPACDSPVTSLGDICHISPNITPQMARRYETIALVFRFFFFFSFPKLTYQSMWKILSDWKWKRIQWRGIQNLGKQESIFCSFEVTV